MEPGSVPYMVNLQLAYLPASTPSRTKETSWLKLVSSVKGRCCGGGSSISSLLPY